VIGVAWDGTGYGLDGHIWGGEFFIGDYGGFRRAAHLEYLPMPGGDAAIRNPWRLALGYIYALTGELPDLAPSSAGPGKGISEQEKRIVRQQVDRHLNTPLTSAVGRLFDAVAALIGIRHRVTYEAQAAIEMEMLATAYPGPGTRMAAYPFSLESGKDGSVIRLKEMFGAVQHDLAAGVSQAEIAWRFHHTLAEMLLTVCQRIRDESALQSVALSGGCFQNRLLLRLAVSRLEQAGFHVLLHRQVPCNDGGISLGQAALAQASVALDRAKNV
jgi:hydrogenase maturation protein HypF